MPSAATITVLVVDDHEINRRITGLFLEPLGWRIVTADNGALAVDAAQTQRFDLILMDMIMPVMNGLEATAAIRNGNGPNRTTPVIAITGDDDSRSDWAAAGVRAFLTKPVDPEHLIETALDALRPPTDYDRESA